MKDERSDCYPNCELLREARQGSYRDDGRADGPEQCVYLAPEFHRVLRVVSAGLALNNTALNATIARRCATGMVEFDAM